MLYSGKVSRELEEKFSRELEPGERLLWLEQPIPRFFTPRSISTFLFGIPWTGFTIFWIYGASGFKIPDFNEGVFSFFPLFGLPFFLVGIIMLLSPIIEYLRASKTIYAITEKRAIIFETGWITSVHSYEPDQFQNIHRQEKSNGTGHVIFGQYVRFGSKGRQRIVDIGFFNIREPRLVEQMIKKLADKKN